MTTLYARSDLAEVITTRGKVYKTKKAAGTHMIDADPADVPELLATGSLVERAHDVPQTFDELREASRLERDGNVMMQAAARHLAEQTVTRAAEQIAVDAKKRR